MPEADRQKEPRPPLFSARHTILFALGIPAMLFGARIAASGIWDPHELNVADLARRIAVNALGASDLVLEGAQNGMPTLGDLRANELPFDSIALGFKLFGLSEWAGRLPLVAWALGGIFALYSLLRRLVDPKAGLYGALVLATMPLYFLHARTMLGDIVTMANLAIAFAGLSIAAFDRARSDEDAGAIQKQRIAWLAVGLLALLGGFYSRGLLIGVAIPAFGVGLSWLASVVSSPKRTKETLGDVAGGVSLVVGALAMGLGSYALFKATPEQFSVLVGAQIDIQAKLPTFDYVIHYLGHSLFPWSAFIPLAVGRLFRRPEGASTEAEEREANLRLLLVVGSSLAFVVYGMMAPRTGHLAFGAPAILAAIAAVTIRDFERGAPPSRAMAIGVAVLTALFLRDFRMFPDKGLSAFAVEDASFPESFKQEASLLVVVSAVLFVGIVFLAWIERESPKFRLDDYRAWPATLKRAWGGNLLFGLVVTEAILAASALVVFLGLRVFQWKQVLALGMPVRVAVLNAFWALPIALVVGVWAAMLLRDGFRALLRAAGISRGFATITAGVLVGALLSFRYYPALAAQLSPRDVFDAYAKMAKAEEPLGLLGIGGRASAYYAKGETTAFDDVPSAYAWLASSPGERRWLAVRNEDLGKLNSVWRTRPNAKGNLPVLDARSSQILLVSNQLGPNERSHNPFDAFVLDEEPSPHRKLSAKMQGMLECLGWEIRDARTNEVVEAVVPAKRYRFRIFYKVIGAVSGDWETFIHIDGYRRRFNGDHKTLGGKYPFSLWQTGDFVVDDYEFALEPNFTPGEYNVYFGLFVGKSRMKIDTGPQNEDRIEAGKLRVQ